MTQAMVRNGRRVRHYGEQYPQAMMFGTGVVEEVDGDRWADGSYEVTVRGDDGKMHVWNSTACVVVEEGSG